MKNLTLIVLGSVLFGASSCSRYYYKPNAVNAPLLTDKNQFHIAGAGSISSITDDDNSEGGNFSFFDVQASYSPVKHLGIIANYSTWAFRADNIDFSKGNVDADAHLAEIGLGTYMASGQGRTKFVADIYAGGGAGSLKSDVDMRARRLFIQPGVGFRHPAVEVGFNMRFSNIKYFDLDDHGRGTAYLTTQNLFDVQRNERIDDRSYFFLEPALTLRTGYKFIKAQFNWTLATELSNVRWNYSESRFTVGLQFNLEEALQLAGEK
ncbi:MAG TPA: hypothetical protein VL098_14540 [Flavipsychrobacter sp.]|nr:hypothetical protein [Flavipsychrobacter sp.]